jgi:uncharacterized protein
MNENFNAPAVEAPAEGRFVGTRYIVPSIVRHTAPLHIRVALFALRFYKAYLSLLFAGNCRFEPTCSRYAYEAIERFGLARGVWLGTKRLLRCHPLSKKFGYDPVPEKWEKMSSETTSIAVHEAQS